MKVTKPKKGFLDWHRHPFSVPVITFMILFFISCAGFIFFSGEAVTPSDNRLVHLYVDGEARVIPTRAKTVGDALRQAAVELREGDLVEPSQDTPIIEEDFYVNIYRTVPVTVVDKNKRITTRVLKSTLGDMAKSAGFEVFPEDRVMVAPPDEVLSEGLIGAKVIINRATPAIINIYGTNIETRTHAKTVGELLEEKGIEPRDGDTLKPSLDTPISENMQVFIATQGKQIQTIEEIIEPPLEKIKDPNALAGTTTIRDPGRPGKKAVTYEIEIQNGQEIARRPIQEFVAIQPMKRVVAEGTKIVISNPSANVALGERMAAERGWTGEQWLCLYQLWQKESKWNHLAGNKSSGAYGIPQSLPGSKMATAGADWQFNPETQIRWGLGYIARGYTTPCGAWAKSRASGWY